MVIWEGCKVARVGKAVRHLKSLSKDWGSRNVGRASHLLCLVCDRRAMLFMVCLLVAPQQVSRGICPVVHQTNLREDHSPTPVRQYEGLESPKGSPSPSRRRSGTNPFGDARGESASPKLIKEVRKRLPESSLVSSPTALSPSRIRSSLVPTSFSPTATTPTVSKQLIAKPISQRASFSSRSSSSGVSSRGD